MKIHELIEALREASQEAEVFCECAESDGSTWTVAGVTKFNWGTKPVAVIVIGKNDGPAVPD